MEWKGRKNGLIFSNYSRNICYDRFKTSKGRDNSRRIICVNYICSHIEIKQIKMRGEGGETNKKKRK